MTTDRKNKPRPGLLGSAATANLDDVLFAIGARPDLPETRWRDLRSAVKRVASLIGDDPALHSARTAFNCCQACQPQSGSVRPIHQEFQQHSLKFLGRREGERPPFGPPLRPGALEPCMAGPAAGALDPTCPSRSVALRPLCR